MGLPTGQDLVGAMGLTPLSPLDIRQRQYVCRLPYQQKTLFPEMRHAPYGELPTAGVGLLFMCYQRDIAKQFEYLQARLTNNPDHLRDQTGIDPIIGQARDGTAVLQQWPAQWSGCREQRVPFRFYGFVTPKGGEYFFAPSINFLRTV